MAGLRALAVGVVGGAAGVFAIAALIAGCGGDDNNPTPDGATPDQSAEASPDVTVDTGKETGPGTDAKEAGPDVTVADADAGKADADSGAPDTGRDADASAPDARDAADASDGAATNDAADASDASDASDAPNALQIYATQYGQAMCAGLLRCCAGFDAGGFDLAGCATANQTGGWDTTLPNSAAAYTTGHLALNADAGAGCLTALRNFDCTAGSVSAAGNGAVLHACNGVFTGNIAVGSATPCVSSFECQSGFCAIPDGGTQGTCTALAGSGGTCVSPTGIDTKDQMCSQAGTVPSLFCDIVDADGGTAHCTAPLADNATCFNGSFFDDYGCANLICGDNGCGTPTAFYPDPAMCTFYGPKDAGTD